MGPSYVLQLVWGPTLVHKMVPYVTARDKISQPSPSVFTYCKRSNTGGGNGLGTRLLLLLTAGNGYGCIQISKMLRDPIECTIYLQLH